MTLPKFIGIGAPRCGTRWLAQCLSEHPQVAIPPDEVYFFTTRRMVHSFWSRGVEWYSGLFEKYMRTGVTTWGEITPVYLLDDDTPLLMHKWVPDAKLICCLRDQSERAFSWYRLFLKVNPYLFTTEYSFKTFMTYHTEVYGTEGFYLEHLERYFEYYSRESILILLYDDLEKDPANYIKRIYEYLEVDASYAPASMAKKINPMILQFHKNKSLNRITMYLRRFRRLQRLARQLDKLNTLQVPSSQFPSRHRLSSEIRQRMYELYAEHNRRLGNFLGRDLSHWNRG